MTDPAETEIPTGVALDQPRSQEGFPCIAEGERHGAPDCPVAGEIGHNGRGDRPDGDRPSRIPPEGNQDARGNTRGRPKDGDAIRLAPQKKTKTRSQKIRHADRNGQRDELDRPPFRTDVCGEAVIGSIP